MVGYSALTQKNEALALELLSEHRQILRPLFAEHGGREIETAGDSFFVEFNSAVEATKCAIQIQKELNDRNKSKPEEKNIRIRIGLHIGDVVYLDEHVHGDGVNIAARMEPLAQPGGICISEDVARQIRNKIPYPVLKLPDEKLKNISMPIDVYCIALPWLKQDVRTKTLPVKKIVLFSILLLVLVTSATFFYYQDKTPPIANPVSKFRLAVLPLTNISNDTTNEYFADGMTDELISALSKIGGLNVIARTSVMKYKKTNKDITQIGKELMAGTILEGTVRRFENKAKINVNLVNVSSQESIWTRDYEKELKDIFMIQSEIASDVADELKVRVDAAEKAQLDKNMTANMQAFEDYLIGKHLLNQRTSESIQNAIVSFEKSIQQDRNFALPYASLAYAYTLVGVAGYGNIPREVAEAKARESVMNALEIDESLAEAHAALGYIRFRIDWDWEEAEKELKRAIQIKPSYATAHEWYALFLAIKGRFEEALHEIKTAEELDPLSQSVSNGVSRIYYFRNESDKAKEQVKKTLILEPDYAEAHFNLGMIYHKTKEYKASIVELNKALELSGRRSVILGMLGASYIRLGKTDEARKILVELETPPMNNDKLYASLVIKGHLGQSEEVWKILDKLLADKYGILIYMKVQRDFFPYSNHPNFEQMINKMKL